MPMLAALLVGEAMGVLAGDFVVVRLVEREAAMGGDIFVFLLRAGAILTYHGVKVIVKQSEMGSWSRSVDVAIGNLESTLMDLG